jgi:WD40 repeat protein
MQKNNYKLSKTLEGHYNSVLSASYSPDGKYIASGSKDRTIKIWELKKGNCLQTLKGHEDFSIFTSFNPNGEEIISTSFDQTIRVWKVNK